MYLAFHTRVALLIERVVSKHDSYVVRVGMLQFCQRVPCFSALRTAKVDKLVDGNQRVQRAFRVPAGSLENDGRLLSVITDEPGVEVLGCWSSIVFRRGGEGGVIRLIEGDSYNHNNIGKKAVQDSREGHRSPDAPRADTDGK